MLSAAPVCDVDAKALKYTCLYSTMKSPTANSGKGMEFSFVLDELTGKAVIVGNAGMNDVEVYAGQDGVTFLERIPTGAVQTTTIDKFGSSVHSRNTIMEDGKLFPSQFYGTCRLGE